MQNKMLLLTCLLVCAAGCAGKNTQLTTCQTEKDQLLATIRNQRDANRTLNDKLASVESRLDQAEKELARAGGSGTRISSNFSDSPPTTTASGDSLPWRAPAAKKTANDVRR
jgi:septal ring factor EnvC (AmiA/AmiB activator)